MKNAPRRRGGTLAGAGVARAVGSALVCIALLPSVLAAQWPARPTPGLAGSTEGPPDPSGSPPRTADGRIDFSGVWVGVRSIAPGGIPGVTAPPNGVADRRAPIEKPFDAPFADYYDIGARIPGGVPLKPPAELLKRERVASHMRDNPEGRCLPPGHLQLWMNEQPRQIVQTPREIVILWEVNYARRHIFTDGRPSPDNDPQPWWYGYTVGRWEGDTLVATTTNLRDGMWLDLSGTPLSDRAVIVERIRRPVHGTLDMEVTIEDSETLMRPFTVRLLQRLLPDSDLIEFICHENERSSQHFIK